jgi:hypothetical protein
MRTPSDPEQARLAAEQTTAMGDLCNIYAVSRSSGTYGTHETETSSIASGVACGFYFTGGRTIQRGNLLLVDYDVLLRLPAGQVISIDYEVELIEKGQVLVSGTFRPFSQPTFNSTVQHVALKRIAT